MQRNFAGRFREPELVARGGMGNVEAAHDPLIGRRVAIKTLHSELLEDERALERFIIEAQITGQLEHPNVVPIYDFGEDTADPFIVMRLVQGQSLSQLLGATPKPATSVEAGELLQRFVQIVLRVSDALSFAHGRGVFHCDVKPDNIMVGEHGQVYLMDWGVALRDRPRDGFGGTVAYMAPEQLLGRTDDIDDQTDVFGLGGVLYQMMTGVPPNDPAGLLAAARGESVLSFTPRELWTQLPPELCRITAKALAPARENRYQNIAALRADLEQFLRGGGWFDTLRVARGEAVVTEGEPGSTAYIIQSGTCEVWKLIHGKRSLVRRLGPGDVFGETAVFAGGLRTATILAGEDVTLRVVTGESLNRELDQNPTLAAFVRSLANLFKETDAALSARGGQLPSRRPSEPSR